MRIGEGRSGEVSGDPTQAPAQVPKRGREAGLQSPCSHGFHIQSPTESPHTDTWHLQALLLAGDTDGAEPKE